MKTTIILIFIILIFILMTYKTKPVNLEGFADVHGMTVMQHKDYVNCLSKCHRASSTHFRDSFTNMQLHCDRKCNRKADKAVRDGYPLDMHIDDFNRHSLEFAASMEREKKHCEKEVSEWCKMDYCSHVDDPSQCQSSCERINNYKCKSGMNWSWKP